MSACRNAFEANEDVGRADLAGLEVQHDLHLAIRDWSAWTAISERLSTAGADIHALQLARADDGYSVRCRLEHVSESTARALTYAFLDEGIAQRGGIEHLVLPKRAKEQAR